jgi:LPXTG-motif cell wall-anchored protein
MGAVTLEFSAVVSATAGTYVHNARADAGSAVVVGMGEAGLVVVTARPTPPSSPLGVGGVEVPRRRTAPVMAGAGRTFAPAPARSRNDPSAASGELPLTGGFVQSQGALAIAVLLLGAGLVAVGRRPSGA